VMLALKEPPSPHDAADALAVAICHANTMMTPRTAAAIAPVRVRAASWRTYKPVS
jgi:Holliday junction resolvasome RuvABC endonuclease subunit